MKTTFFNKIFLLPLISLLFTITSQAETLRMAYSVAPKTIDPYKSSASATASLNEHLYEALVSRTND